MTDDYYTHMMMVAERESFLYGGKCPDTRVPKEWETSSYQRELYHGYPTTCTDSDHGWKCKVEHMSEHDRSMFRQKYHSEHTLEKGGHECWWACNVVNKLFPKRSY